MAVKSLAQSSILQPSGVNSLLGDYEGNYFHHLETVRLSSSASSVTFSNLAQYSDYQHLQIRMVARHTSSNGYGLSEVDIQFNSDAGTNYSIHGLLGNGGSVTSYGAANTALSRVGYFTGNQATAGAFGVSVIDILDAFEVNKYKTVRSLTGAEQGYDGIDPDRAIGLFSSSWRSLSAVNSITLFRTSLSFATGSRFSLYGLKARS